MAETNIFRKQALKKMSSPEELDQLLIITKPSGWISLIAVAAVIIAGLLWGIFGSAVTKVEGDGIIISRGGIIDIVSLGEGQVTNILITNGQNVHKDDVLANISQPELTRQLENARLYLSKTDSLYKKQLEYLNNFSRQTNSSLDSRRAEAEKSVALLTEKIAYLEKNEINIQNLLEKGLATEKQLYQLRDDLNNARKSLLETKNQLSAVNLERSSSETQYRRQILESEQELLKAQRNVLSFESDMKFKSRVVSNSDGKIIEITCFNGKYVTNGMTVFRLQANPKDNAILFLSASDGKKVAKGMKTFISPANAKPEDYGYMLGTVENVSDYPSTTENILNIIQNKTMVDMLTRQGPPILVTVALIFDSTSSSGFKWTSSRGPDYKITKGTMCSGGIQVSEMPPLTLIFPYIKKKIGLY